MEPGDGGIALGGKRGKEPPLEEVEKLDGVSVPRFIDRLANQSGIRGRTDGLGGILWGTDEGRVEVTVERLAGFGLGIGDD